IVYRRTEKEMPARQEEVEHAREEGVRFRLLTNPVEVLGDDNLTVKGLRCISMRLGKPDESGRRRPIPVPGSEFNIEVDNYIVAIGQTPNPLVPRTTPGLRVETWGGISIRNESGWTYIDDVWAGGDIVTGAATVISAMGAGKKGAKAIDMYLRSNTGS
ncbi:MAG: FAD-dependent oxidoreductase, partial [Spirochaetes bacterium]|nr:FAD-dependent oxidoreductase [Spirochaetota bacterium]